MENTDFLPNLREFVSSCHFYLAHVFPQHILSQQVLDTSSIEGAMKNIGITETINTLSFPKDVMKLWENQNHSTSQTAWTLRTKVTYFLHSHSLQPI